MIRRDIVDEIIRRNDIESLVGSYVSLKRAGSNLKGLCPFHSEKTPSFTVFPSQNSFYCFGCGIGGNPITFIRQIEHLDYRDAVVFLGKRVGITVTLEDESERYTSGPRLDKERIYKMNVEAANFFHRCLFADTEQARAALEYFTVQRGLSMATVRHFGLGYAPPGFEMLGRHLKSKGYTYDEMAAAFLVGKSERGSYYDAFRNRVMFPIIDVAGRVIAFGGRVMDDSKPKYKNSSDTPVFKKLQNLFALNFARQSCAEVMILCEGYMDVIAMHAAGFTNAVATLGTAITDEQARLMSKYTKRVIIAYDADEPGQKAAKKAIQKLGDVGLDVSVLKVPGAKDPDEYIKAFGKDKFRELLEGSKSKFEYNFDNILSGFDLSRPQDRINALGALANMIAGFYSATERDVYIRISAERLGVSRESLQKDVDRLLRINAGKKRKEEGEKARQNAAGLADRVNPDFAKAPAVAKNEEAVLGLLLLFPNHRRRAFETGLLTDADFFTAFGKRVYAAMEKAYAEGDELALETLFSPVEIGRITKMKLDRMELSDNGDAVFDEAVDSLKRSILQQNAMSAGSFEDLSRLILQKRNEDTDPK